jgi:hypothetical protein
VRVPRHDVVPAHEPADVVEEGVDRQRLRLTRRQAAFGDVGFECRYFAAVEVPIGAGAQEHAARHAGLPQLERLADDDGLEPGRLGVRCRREPIRSRTHNQEFGLLHTCRPLNKAVRPTCRRYEFRSLKSPRAQAGVASGRRLQTQTFPGVAYMIMRGCCSSRLASTARGAKGILRG